MAGPSRNGRTGFGPIATIALAAAAIALLWALYLVRETLLVIYISMLLAIGFGPLVSAIEHRKTGHVTRRVPRWLAILLVYGDADIAEVAASDGLRAGRYAERQDAHKRLVLEGLFVHGLDLLGGNIPAELAV